MNTDELRYESSIICAYLWFKFLLNPANDAATFLKISLQLP